MNFVFRVDASTLIGIGHLIRCMTLAEALQKRGAAIKFICREHPGNLIDLLRQKGISVTTLSAAKNPATGHTQTYAVWLGVSQDEDAQQCIAALSGNTPHWLVVDHYGLDEKWEHKMRPYVEKIMAIDDLANRQHDCDVLLDQNYSSLAEQRYMHFIPETCRLLAGPRYALLQPVYALHRRIGRIRNAEVHRILVFFGGSDQHNMTGLALEALSLPEFKDIQVDVVIGANNPHRVSINEQADKRGRATISNPRPHLADLMMEADLALGAGGTTTWERMCLGLPAIVISIAENQLSGCNELAKANLIEYAGDCSDIGLARLTQLLRELIGNRERILEIGMAGRRQVDGLGTSRLVEILMPSEAAEISIRPAMEDDVAAYYHWANDSAVRKNAFNVAPISWPVHTEWFSKKLRDPTSHLFVLTANDLPVGQIRFDLDDGEMNIDYSLDTLVRGRGWGKRLVVLGMESIKCAEPMRFRGVVKYENHASRSVFLNLGFSGLISKSGEQVTYYHDAFDSRID